MKLFETITDLAAGADVIRRRRYGIIEASNGGFVAIHFRPWPKWASIPEMLWGQRRHGRSAVDRCRLYFNQPVRFPNFLAVPYIVSGRGTSLATFYAAIDVLDNIARTKRTDALLADVLNLRISDRFLARRGWLPHKPSRWHRHFIKRFYGEYPPSREPRPGELLTCQSL
ncbi:MAG TPA: hypothetical protein VKB78_16290 [Pirellulales bacterium]|nr:hypothetical protein [Pirellulales bacterium]